MTACVVVKTYPVPATNGIEVSCTAAISETGQWLRLFPVPFRLLERDQRFKKYQWIKLRVRRSKDSRPESHNIDPDSITLVSDGFIPTDEKWDARKQLLAPLKSRSLCALRCRQQDKGYPTLGIFRPGAIRKLIIEPIEANWTDKQLAKLQVDDLFISPPPQQLEKIPYKFSYEFSCNDESCTGHTMMCSDWEMSEAYRRWRREYGEDWEEKFRQKFEREMRDTKETSFDVGTVRQHPNSWIIVGLFYPPL